ncbi:MAG: T9SS type A sorting domain-containing protein [Ferruginibacter sp.]
MKYFIILFFIALTGTANAQYNFYYGNLHSHTDYSDGNKDALTTGVADPAGSFAYAKNSYHIDFWGISEHNHFSSTNNPGMLLPKYSQGLTQADQANQNGSFVAMYGMEWGTISEGGHVLTYGSPSLIGWETISGSPNYNIFCAKGDYPSYWNILNAMTNTFSTLAHPQPGDYGNLMNGAPFSPAADMNIAGSAIRSGGAFSTTNNYTDPPATLYEDQFMLSLAKGYHVGPAIDHDNHYTTFGRTNKGRTVVLARSLHRDSIIAAFRQRRFYASDDWNTQVNFNVNGNLMGTVNTTLLNSSLNVSVTDIDPTDVVSNIKIYYGIPGSGALPTLLGSNSGSGTFAFTHSTNNNDKFYYYAKITQNDGDIIWTAPVWIQRQSTVSPVTLLTSFNAYPDNKNIMVDWTAGNLAGLGSIDLEYSVNNISFSTLAVFPPQNTSGIGSSYYHYTHVSPPPNLYYYRLKFIKTDNTFSYSDTVSARLSQDLPVITIFPNPATEKISFIYTGLKDSKAVLNIYNSDGRLSRSKEIFISQNENTYSVDLAGLPTGLYFLTVQQPDLRIIDTKFIKN